MCALLESQVMSMSHVQIREGGPVDTRMGPALAATALVDRFEDILCTIESLEFPP